MSLTANQVWRDFNTAGVPASGDHEPVKSEIRQWASRLEAAAGIIVKDTLSQLQAVTPAAETYGGIVLNDSTASNNGYYYRSGGAWVKGKGFPDTFARITLGGTANAQTGAVDSGVNPADVEVYYAVVTTANTGAMTLSISGETARDVVNAAGNALSAGEWTGVVLFFVNEDGDYQLLINPGAEAAAAQSATDAAQSAADAQAIATQFGDMATAIAETEEDADRAEAAAASVLGLDATSVQGRLSLTSGVAVPSSDVTGATTIYYVPCAGKYAPIYDGTRFVSRSIAAQLSMALDSAAANTGYHQSGKNFDVYLFMLAGVPTLGTGPAWTSDTGRGTGASTTELEVFNGLLVNKNEIQLRYGSTSTDLETVPLRQATYVGSFRATADGQATDTARQRLLFNAFNQALRPMRRRDSTVSWTYSTDAWRQSNASALNQIEFLLGLDGIEVSATASSMVTTSTSTTRSTWAAIGLDGVADANIEDGCMTGRVQPVTGQIVTVQAHYEGVPGLGYHYLIWMERGGTGDTQTWYGHSSGLTKYNTGIIGKVLN